MRLDVPIVFALDGAPLSDPDSVNVKLKIHAIQHMLADQRMLRDERFPYVVSEPRIL